MAHNTFKDRDPLVYFAIFNKGRSRATIKGCRIPWSHVDRLRTSSQKEVQGFAAEILGKHFISPPITHVDWWISRMSDPAEKHFPTDGYNEADPTIHFCFVYYKAVEPHFVTMKITPAQLLHFLSLGPTDQRSYAEELCNFSHMAGYVKMLDWFVSGSQHF